MSESIDEREAGDHRSPEPGARPSHELGQEDLADDGALVLSELVSNAVLRGGGCTGIDIDAVDGGLRVEVRDASCPTTWPPSSCAPTG